MAETNMKRNHPTDNEKKTPPSIIIFLERFLSIFERERFGILTMFIWIVALSAFRMWTEAFLLNYPYKEISYDFIFYHVHITSFFVTAYIGGVVILKYFTRESVAKIANLAGIGFVMVVVPPFIDVLMSANPEPYSYVSPLRLVETLKRFIGSGVLYELLGISSATALYVFIKLYSQGIGKAIGKSILNGIVFLAFFIYLGSPFLPELNSGAGPLKQPVMIIRYIGLSVVLLLLLLYFSDKKLLKSFIKSSRLLTTAHFALMTFIGIMIAGHLQTIESIQLDVFSFFSDPINVQIFTGNISMFFLSLITIVFIWQYAVMINHVFDVNIDTVDNKDRLLPSGLMTRKQVVKIAAIYAIISLGLGFLMGFWTLLIVAVGLLFGTLYSVPPIRIRDSIFSTTIIGIGSSIAFFLGYYTPAYIKVMYGEFAGRVMRVYPEFTIESAIIGFLIFIALTIGPLVKDYKDYEGDKKAGVKNLFTIYGLEKGVKITSILLPIPFFCLLLLFHAVVDNVILIPAGLLAGFLFHKYRNTQLVFAIYFPVILYCLLRWFHIINF